MFQTTHLKREIFIFLNFEFFLGHSVRHYCVIYELHRIAQVIFLHNLDFTHLRLCSPGVVYFVFSCQKWVKNRRLARF